VERESFFSQALLITYREIADQSDLPEASSSGWMSHVASRIYRGQLGNEPLKSFRWWNETVAGPALGSGDATRNSLINEPVVTLDDRNPDRTDILMSFSQELTARAEADMQRMTRALIDRISEIGGSYYLPYRPHPTVDQFVRTYRGAAKFAAAKRQIDPDLVLRNNFWDSYLEQL